MTGGSARTTLANNVQYASYVNDGHHGSAFRFWPDRKRWDVAVASGKRNLSEDDGGGITVGTKTKYVKGKYMKQAAIGR